MVSNRFEEVRSDFDTRSTLGVSEVGDGSSYVDFAFEEPDTRLDNTFDLSIR